MSRLQDRRINIALAILATTSFAALLWTFGPLYQNLDWSQSSQWECKPSKRQEQLEATYHPYELFSVQPSSCTAAPPTTVTVAKTTIFVTWSPLSPLERTSVGSTMYEASSSPTIVETMPIRNSSVASATTSSFYHVSGSTPVMNNGTTHATMALSSTWNGSAEVVSTASAVSLSSNSLLLSSSTASDIGANETSSSTILEGSEGLISATTNQPVTLLTVSEQGIAEGATPTTTAPVTITLLSATSENATSSDDSLESVITKSLTSAMSSTKSRSITSNSLSNNPVPSAVTVSLSGTSSTILEYSVPSTVVSSSSLSAASTASAVWTPPPSLEFMRENVTNGKGESLIPDEAYDYLEDVKQRINATYILSEGETGDCVSLPDDPCIDIERALEDPEMLKWIRCEENCGIVEEDDHKHHKTTNHKDDDDDNHLVAILDGMGGGIAASTLGIIGWLYRHRLPFKFGEFVKQREPSLIGTLQGEWGFPFDEEWGLTEEPISPLELPPLENPVPDIPPIGEPAIIEPPGIPFPKIPNPPPIPRPLDNPKPPGVPSPPRVPPADVPLPDSPSLDPAGFPLPGSPIPGIPPPSISPPGISPPGVPHLSDFPSPPDISPPEISPADIIPPNLSPPDLSNPDTSPGDVSVPDSPSPDDPADISSPGSPVSPPPSGADSDNIDPKDEQEDPDDDCPPKLQKAEADLEAKKREVEKLKQELKEEREEKKKVKEGLDECDEELKKLHEAQKQLGTLPPSPPSNPPDRSESPFGSIYDATSDPRVSTLDGCREVLQETSADAGECYGSCNCPFGVSRGSGHLKRSLLIKKWLQTNAGTLKSTIQSNLTAPILVV